MSIYLLQRKKQLPLQISAPCNGLDSVDLGNYTPCGTTSSEGKIIEDDIEHRSEGQL